MENNKQKNNSGCYIWTGFIALILVTLIKWIWPTTIPFSLFQFFETKGTIFDWLYEVRYWYTIMLLITFLSYFTNRESRRENSRNSPQYYFIGGFVDSAVAGIFEELVFRWILFFLAIIFLKVMNFIFLGFAGIDVIEWFYMKILWPIANFFTLGYLVPFLVGVHWSVTAGMISANIDFRNGHFYLGIIGWIHSWFAGMILFYIMFKFGIVAAMVVHFLYDYMLYFTSGVLRILNPRGRGGVLYP